MEYGVFFLAFHFSYRTWQNVDYDRFIFRSFPNFTHRHVGCAKERVACWEIYISTLGF